MFCLLELVEKVEKGVFYLIHFAGEIWSLRFAGVTREVSGANVTNSLSAPPRSTARAALGSWIFYIIHHRNVTSIYFKS